VQKFFRLLSTVHQSTNIPCLYSIISRFRCLFKDPNLCLWLRIVAVVAAKLLTRIRFHFRDAVWTDADQSWIGFYSIKIPARCEQENCCSIGVGHKNLPYDTRWWNVVADQKAVEVVYCSICLYKIQENTYYFDSLS